MQTEFIVEKYCDPRKTLFQAIEIPIDAEENLRNQYRGLINRDLTWLHEIMYLDKNRKWIYSELYDIDGNFIRRDEPWKFDNNKNRYTAGVVPEGGLL